MPKDLTIFATTQPLQNSSQKMPTAQTAARLRKIFAELGATGEGMPISARAQGRPAVSEIARRAGLRLIDVHGNRVLRRLIDEAHIRLGSGQIIDDRVSGDTTEIANENRRRLRRYLDDLQASGTGLPCLPGRPDGIHWAAVARESGLGVQYFTGGRAPGRPVVEARRQFLGLQIRANREPEKTFRDLLEYALSRRKSEVAGQASAAQQLANLKAALTKVMRAHSANLDDAVGPALALFAVRLEGQSDGTSRKLRSEIARLTDFLASIDNCGELPADFAGALKCAIRRSGQTPHALATRLECHSTLLSRWLAGVRIPGNSKLPLVAKLETILLLQPGTLSSRIRSRRHGNGRFPAHLYPPSLRDDRRLRSRISKLLPVGWGELCEADRHAIVFDLVSKTDETTDFGKAHRERVRTPYKLKTWPEKLELEWNQLVEFRTATIAPVGTRRRHARRWADKTATIYRGRLESFFGYLTQVPEGPHLPKSNLSFSMLSDPDHIHGYLSWIIERNKTLRGKAYHTSTDIDLVTFAASLVAPEIGWLTQRRDLAPAENVGAKWTKVCDNAHRRYKELEADLRSGSSMSRDSFEAIYPILAMENPRNALEVFVEALKSEEAKLIPGTKAAARAARDFVMVAIMSQTGLRSKNIRQLTWKADGRAQLRCVDGVWRLNIARGNFKNQMSCFFGPSGHRHDYSFTLIDRWGLFAALEDYVTVHRPVLLQGAMSDTCFISSHRTPEFGEVCFASRFRELVRRHLVGNPVTGSGIAGVKIFGPHSVRHIIATHIIKKTGDLQLAADAIHDSIQTVKNHYARFLPADRSSAASNVLWAG